jgi:DNA replication protein DnaC
MLLARRENALLLGNSRTEETHTAQAQGLAACQRGHRVRFTTTAGSQIAQAWRTSDADWTKLTGAT